jgi:hypothetical protein
MTDKLLEERKKLCCLQKWNKVRFQPALRPAESGSKTAPFRRVFSKGIISMVNRMLIKLAVTLIGAALLCGCTARRVQMYPGSAKKPDEIALIKAPEAQGIFGTRIHIVAVDGDLTVGFMRNLLTGATWAGAVEVLPGKHDFRISWESGIFSATGDYCLVAEAGASYTVKANQKGYGVLIWLEDDKTGEAVGGIKGGCEAPSGEPLPGADSIPQHKI